MKRYCDINEISDGHFYNKDDRVLADCKGCENCHQCCQGMGDSIVLDPYDVYRLTKGCNCRLDDLLLKHVALTMDEGVVLPHLKMDESTGCCTFLNAQGRCSIHAHRPGICRLFPLGRIYEKETFYYFLQVHECTKQDRGEVVVSDWLQTDDITAYEKYILDWHNLLRDWKTIIRKKQDEHVVKQMVMYLLQQFFRKGYRLEEAFYPQFYERLEETQEIVKELKQA